MNGLKRHSITLSFALILILSFFTASNVKWGGDRWHGLIAYDGHGYYAYLPAIFIYQDLNYSFYDRELLKDRKERALLNYDYREDVKGGKVDKYYAGTALAELPFFLIAHALSSPLGFDDNGYSRIYYIFISIAAIFYVFLGLWFFNKTLKLYEINKLIRIISVFAIFLGTHLFYYSMFEPGMSHVYSFAFISMFIYYGKKYFQNPGIRRILILSALLGMITIIRPVNALVFFLLPFLAGSWTSFSNGLEFKLKGFVWKLLAAILPFFILVFIQLLIYKISTDHFIVYSYNEEGFNFLNPQMINILFSYKKGLFLYTPLCFLSLFGFYFLRKNSFEAISLFLFLVLITYVFSSWWNWWYGGSFSSRVYVEFLSLFGILLAVLLSRLKTRKYFYILLLMIVISILFNQKQIKLYRKGVIHYVNMDQEKYWNTFFRFQ